MRLFGKHKENIIYYMLYLFSDVFSKALPFLLLPFLTRIFSTEQYGELTEFTVVYNICFMLGAFSCQTFFRKLFFENNDMGGRYLSLLISPLIITITKQSGLSGKNTLGSTFVSLFLWYPTK